MVGVRIGSTYEAIESQGAARSAEGKSVATREERTMKTTHLILMGLAAGLFQTVWAADITATLDSTDGSSSFVVQDALTNSLLTVHSDGKVGIGTNSPNEELEVNGTAPSIRVAGGNAQTASLQLYEITSGTPYGFEFVYDGSDDTLNLWSRGFSGGDYARMKWHKNGKVGIGTTDNEPFELHVNGERGFRVEPKGSSPNFIVGNPSNASITNGSFGLTIAGGKDNTIDWAAHSTIAGGYDNSIGYQCNMNFIGAGWGNQISTLCDRCVVGGGYNNEIGEDSDSSFIGGGSYNTIGSNSTYATIPGGANCAIGDNADYAFAAGRRAKANHQGSFVWADSTSADFASTTNDQFLIRASGGVGIGTTSPDEMLHVSGNVKATSFIGDGSSLAGVVTPTGDQNFDGGTLFIDSTDHEVGIGTDDPKDLLHVYGTSDDRVLIHGTDSVPKLHFRRTNSGIDWVMRLEPGDPSKFHFQTELTDGNEVMTLDGDGRVGIGTTAPARKLHVKDVLRLEPRSSAPGSPSAGDMYFSSTVNKLMVYDGSTWQACW